MKLIGKRIASLNALTIVLIMAAAIIASLPYATAATKTNTTAFLSINPKLVQVGKTVLINAWITPPPKMYVELGIAPPAGVLDWAGVPRTGYMFTITKPDGETSTVGPRTSTGEGATWFLTTADVIGTWKVKFKWAGDDLFNGCESPDVTFTVQSGEVPGLPAVELPGPNDYWERPINTDNREWSTIIGGWLETRYDASRSSFNPYTTAPNSAHILWKRQTAIGGLIGGEFGTGSYGAGVGVNIILAGRAYYNTPDGINCIDMRTGEKLWTMPGSVTVGQQGSTPYLWGLGTSYNRYVAFTGNLTLSLSAGQDGIAQGGSNPWTSDGSMYLYSQRGTGGVLTKPGWLVKWSASRVSGTNWLSGVVWNVTLPAGTGPHIIVSDGVVVFPFFGDKHVGFNATTGAKMWEQSRESLYCTAVGGYGMYFNPISQEMRWYAYNVYTGEVVWKSDVADYPWGAFWSYGLAVAYNKLYAGCYDGHLYAYDVSTGHVAWKFYSGDTTETPYGTWPFWLNPIVADGKVYAGTSEHSPTIPRNRGNKLFCLDANTGVCIWNISGAVSPSAIAEGSMLATNENDGVLYCFSKGKTATTVSASPKVISAGGSLLIEGTIMDLSPAQANTPAIADVDMTAWMEYLHMQKPKPENVQGVPVKLEAVASNGAVTNIGSVTSDKSGLFSAMWQPPSQGKYTIIATFEGSESYWPSYAETAVGVGNASPSGSESGNPIAALPVEAVYAIAIIIVVAIVAATALLLRKRA